MTTVEAAVLPGTSEKVEADMPDLCPTLRRVIRIWSVRTFILGWE
jgi:hypothetical protein